MDPEKKDGLLAAAKQLCDLMHQWNVVDLYELMIDTPADGGSAYHHTTKALKKILGYFGLGETTVFYDLVTQGETPYEALDKALEVQNDRAL